MIVRDGNLLRVTSPMTMETVGVLLDAGTALFGSGETEFDLAAVPDVDSAALALMLEWTRLAGARKVQLIFSNLPHDLTSLATLYGALELIPQRATASH